MIYEALGREAFADNLLANLPAIRETIPPHYRWLEDYTKPEGLRHGEMTEAEFHRIAERLKTRKEADCMVGLSVDRDEVITAGPAFAQTALAVMRTLLPVYRLAELAAV